MTAEMTLLWDLFSLLPAPAGVIPSVTLESVPVLASPRTCGGDPVFQQMRHNRMCFSPHLRG